MRLNTETLFYLLLKNLQPQLVCDIGSLDASHARRFHELIPNSHIIAFEANPTNIHSMRKNKNNAQDSIEIQHKVVLNYNGISTFYIEKTTSDKNQDWRQGISSTRKRLGGSLGTKLTKVKSVRLDTFIKNLDYNPKSIALWIDVEGSAFEVLEGIKEIRNKIRIIHVEVEIKELWQGQKLKPAVEILMKKMGFFSLAQGFNNPQHDLIFINSYDFAQSPTKYRIIVFFVLVITYLGFLVVLFPYARQIISKLDIVRRIKF